MHFARSLAVSVGMALASSCLAMIAGMASRAGWWLLPAIGISALIALAVAHAIGGLARRFPSALGVRTYVKAAFGNTVSLFFVFLYMAMIVGVAAVESNLYADIVQQLMPAVPPAATLLAVFGAVFALNVVGAEASRSAQLVLVVLMLGGLLALSVCGIVQAPAATVPPPATQALSLSLSQLAALPTVTVTAFFLFVGFEWVTSSQPPSRQAAAQLPRVLLLAVAVLGAAYLLFAAAALTQLDSTQLAATRTPQMLLARILWGEAGRWAMLLVSTAAVLMAFNAGVLGASRLLYSLAREGCLPRWLARTSQTRAVPVNAIAATVLLALLASLVSRHLRAGDLLGGIAAVLICLCYAGLLASSLRLARREGARWQVWAVEAAALPAMCALLLAMLFDATAWNVSLGAASVCLVCAALALRLGSKTPAAKPRPAPQQQTRPLSTAL
jgi:amino acid transporter